MSTKTVDRSAPDHDYQQQLTEKRLYNQRQRVIREVVRDIDAGFNTIDLLRSIGGEVDAVVAVRWALESKAILEISGVLYGPWAVIPERPAPRCVADGCDLPYEQCSTQHTWIMQPANQSKIEEQIGRASISDEPMLGNIFDGDTDSYETSNGIALQFAGLKLKNADRAEKDGYWIWIGALADVHKAEAECIELGFDPVIRSNGKTGSWKLILDYSENMSVFSLEGFNTDHEGIFKGSIDTCINVARMLSSQGVDANVSIEPGEYEAELIIG